MTTDALALTIVGVLYLILFTWAFRVLPQEEWQVMAAIPLQKLHDGFWTGMNLTYYGALTATGVGVAAGVDRALPAVFARIHPRYRTPHVVLVFQGLAASLIFLVSLFFTVGGARTSIQEAYDIMVNLTILIYFLPYLYLFISLVRLRARDSRENNAAQYRVPGGRVGLWFVAGAGGIATAVSLGLVFVPPPGTGNVLNYETNLIGQALIILAIGFILYRRKSSIPAAQGRIP